MLKQLHISNFAIVPALDLEFHSGFTAITGETGAGKSILVDALGLLLGERSDAAWVRNGAKRAELTAEFSLANNLAAATWLEDNELSTDTDCLLRRTINASGRSRAFINGTPVTVTQMQSLGHLLVEIHGQNEHLKLAKPGEQFKLLDNSGHYTKELDLVRSSFSDWKTINEDILALHTDAMLSGTELEFLKFQLEELQQHDLSTEAIETLQSEHDRLAAGDELLAALANAIELLEPETSNEKSGINTGLNRILAQLREFTHLDSNIDDACQMLQEAAVNCSEASTALHTARERVDLNPARFNHVASVLGQLNDLARKHTVRMEALLAVENDLSKRIGRAGSSAERHIELQTRLTSSLEKYRLAAKNLSKKRSQHAQQLSEQVAVLMSELGMAGGSFEIKITYSPQSNPSSRGDDMIGISISANPGVASGPLNKIASGGELSRISLAIKVAASGSSEAVTQIFDEVDAGIGGDTANAVGKLLQRLSGNGQALCVTHLAQVAVCADHQLQVRKASGEISIMVDTNLLDKKDRVDEIARMLSGKVSAQSRAHAAELLSGASVAHK